MRFTHRPRFTRFAQAQPRVTHLNCLEEGTDGRTDTLSARAGRLALPRQRRRCGGKKAEARTAGHPGQQQGEPLAPLNAVWGPVAGTHVLLFFCLISLQPGFCQKGFAVDTGERGLGRREPGRRRRPFSLLCRGDKFQNAVGWARGVRDRGSALRPPPPSPRGCSGARGDTDGDHHCHPCPAGARGTFGAEERRVLLPGAAELLQGRIFGLEVLELLQAVLQAPRSLQHRSGVCGQQGWRSGARDGHHCPHPTLVATGMWVPPSLSLHPKGSSHPQPAYKQGRSPRMPPQVPPHVPPRAPHHHPKAPEGPSAAGGRIRASRPQTRWHPRHWWPRSPQFGLRQWQFVPR